ncbi:MAG: hypothetical protein HYS70_03250 [Nitrospinae bacterium]|nr:hypothetical protein [Nitrospinota bacterium]
MNCPYYEKVNKAMAQRGVRGYCTGYPTQGIMVPSIMEEKKYCARDNGYLKCPVYRARQAMGREGGDAEANVCYTLL